jgi:uncharacterized membrane protein
MTDLQFVLTLLATLGCGMMVGIFFAFSSFLMRALGQRPAREGMAAMQAINVVIVRPSFLLVFMGTAALSVLLIIASLLWWTDAGAVWRIVGSVLYLIGSIVVTVIANVPRNNALAALSPDDPNSGPAWLTYQSEWTRWNHVRAVMTLAATAAFALALKG